MAQQPELVASEETALTIPTEAGVEVFDPQAIAAAFRESLQGEQINAWDFDRVKVPGAGGTTWTIPSVDGEQEAKTFTGIIAYTQLRRSYWARSFDESGGSPPDCSSNDSLLGHGIRWAGDVNEPHDCLNCAWAQFGSDGKGTGQACQKRRFLFIQREGEMLPLLLSVPPASLKAVRQYLFQLAGRGKASSEVVTRFELAKTKNAGGIAYSQVVPKLERLATPAEVAAAKGIGGVLRGLLDTIGYLPDDFST